jgi:RimJ/RimL family protein N-acetyltransferase
LDIAAPIQTLRLILRPVVPGDVDGPYLRWMQDDDILRYTEARFVSRDDVALKSYVAAMLASPENLFLAMILRTGQRHIGNIKIGPISRHHRRGDIGLIIGARNCWGQGYAPEAIAAITAYAFGTLGLAKATAGCYSANQGSARAFLKAGFRLEGIREKQLWVDGVCNDEWLFGRANPDA